jgi:hypothetical protein
VTSLSIVIPSNRDSLAAYGRIMDAGSWASDRVETILRDNSGSAEKRKILSVAKRPNFKISFAEPCDINTNFLEAFREARGDFVLFLGDDDAAFDRGIAAIAQAAADHAQDGSVAGITGAYVFEDFQASKVAAYQDIDSPDVRTRLGGFLSYDGPNLIFYSAVRRDLILKVWEFVTAHPFRFPFHDQLFSMLYLLSGRFVSVGRLVCVYENTNWEVASGAHEGDQKIYAAAGMDQAIRWLQWVICGFEGASYIIHSSFGARHAPEQRQAVPNAWFATMFGRFVREPIVPSNSPLHPAAADLAQRWKGRHPNFSLEILLEEICGFIGLFSRDKAEAYHAYWTGILQSAPSQLD